MEQDITNVAIGPQYPKDNQFAARMRFHQSWYRTRVLKVPYSLGPRPNSPAFYGNMLTQADGERGLNFFAPQIGQQIFSVVKRRMDEKKGAVTLNKFPDPWLQLSSISKLKNTTV